MPDTEQDPGPQPISTGVARLGAELNDHEKRWRDKQAFLEGRGYLLRARYHPDWVPPWFLNGKHPLDCEDYIRLPFRPNLIDATRICDGKLVYIKRVATGKDEATIACYFSEDAQRSSAANHCVPVLDIFEDDANPAISYLVMPFLRLVDDPPFEYVHDVVDFVDQTMEGLAFMHAHGVAHRIFRDNAYKNLMMDAIQMYPRGFHPVQQKFCPDLRGHAPVVSRLGVWPPAKYYFIDFDLAVKFPADVYPRLVLGDEGQDREVPELSLTMLYDPFKVDVYVLGNVYQKTIYAKFSNVSFLQPLIKSMTERDPARRPDADTALERWRELRGSIVLLQRGYRLRNVGESMGGTIVFDVVAFFKLGILLSRRSLMWTARWLSNLGLYV